MFAEPHELFGNLDELTYVRIVFSLLVVSSPLLFYCLLFFISSLLHFFSSILFIALLMTSHNNITVFSVNFFTLYLYDHLTVTIKVKLIDKAMLPNYSTSLCIISIVLRNVTFPPYAMLFHSDVFVLTTCTASLHRSHIHSVKSL